MKINHKLLVLSLSAILLVGCGETPETKCNHNWGEGVVTTPATAKDNGEMTYTCSECGKTKTSVIEATGGKDSSGFSFNEDIEQEQKIHTTDQANFLKYDGQYFNMTSAELNSYNAKGTQEVSFPEQVKLTWNFEDPDERTLVRYDVVTGQYPDLSDGYTIKGTKNAEISFYNSFLGDNYFKVIANFDDETTAESEIKTFKVEATAPRNLKVGTMSNCRDMGGRTTYAGGKLKQGLIYRTSDPSTSGIGDVSEWVNRMGIKSEIYVKDGGKATGTTGPLGETVKFYNASMDYGATPYSNLARNAERLRYVFEILGDEANYPTMYHCRIGTDRTGICGVMINGILGVPFNEVIQDYAFSNFGKIDGQRYAHKSSDPNGDDIAKYIDEIQAFPGANFQEQCFYALMTIGVKVEHINKLIDMMTIGNKATFPTAITVANGDGLTNNGGTKKSSTDYKAPATGYEISGASQSVSFKYNAKAAGKVKVIAYLGCTNGYSESKKLNAGIDLKIDSASQTIVDKTYHKAGFGKTQQSQRDGYMFSILGEYDLTAGEHTIEIAGKNTDKFNVGSIAVIAL